MRSPCNLPLLIKKVEEEKKKKKRKELSTVERRWKGDQSRSVNNLSELTGRS